MHAKDDPKSEPTASAPVPPPPLKAACRTCGRAIDGHDLFCRYCGTRQVVTDPFYYHPVWILLLAFLVLGPLALPLVWRARAMGREMKFALTAIIVAYSAVTFYYGYILIAAIYRQFSILNQVL